MDTIYSKNGVSIRLTNERWVHINEEHNELAGYFHEVLETVSDPKIIYSGNTNEYLAVKNITDKKYLVVIYREISKKDGFIITSFLTKRLNQFNKRQIIWS